MQHKGFDYFDDGQTAVVLCIIHFHLTWSLAKG